MVGIRTRYRWIAPVYDALEVPPFRRLRAEAVSSLQLAAGATVIDLGCGTGLSFPAIQRAIGSSGKVIGVDLSWDMLARAARRVAEEGWHNVRLVAADAGRLPVRLSSVDAVLCFYTHDVLTSRDAVQSAVASLRPGGRFVAAGGKRARGRASLLFDAVTFAYSWPFARQLKNLSRPWLHLENLAGPVEWDERLGGTAYLVRATRP